MPKLLQINICNAMLSTGKIAEDISKVATRKGWQTYTAWGRFAKPSVSFRWVVGLIHICIMPLINCLIERTWFPSMPQKLIKRIEDIKPDINHLHKIHDHYMNYLNIWQKQMSLLYEHSIIAGHLQEDACIMTCLIVTNERLFEMR